MTLFLLRRLYVEYFTCHILFKSHYNPVRQKLAPSHLVELNMSELGLAGVLLKLGFPTVCVCVCVRV